MRAGRLISLVLLLQQRGRCTARELARELEVSERTVLRDIESLSGAGIPVYATRGPGGGFHLLGDHPVRLPTPGSGPAPRRGAVQNRARVRLTPEGRRMATLLQILQPLRIVRAISGDAEERHEATFPVRSREGVIVELLSLGAEVEVLAPRDLRDEVAARLEAAAARYAPAGRPPPGR